MGHPAPEAGAEGTTGVHLVIPTPGQDVVSGRPFDNYRWWEQAQ
jgi:hypothetical protein